jgi:hypothetical protein
MVGFGAGKATGDKKGKRTSGSGGSGSSHSSSSFPPAMLKKFKQLKEEGCSVARFTPEFGVIPWFRRVLGMR